MKQKIRNRKLYIGLMASFGLITLFSVILTVVGAVTIQNVSGDYAYTIRISEMKIRLLKDAKTCFMTMRYRVANYIMNSGDADYIHQTLFLQFEDAKSQLHEKLFEYSHLNEEDTRQNAEDAAKSIRDVAAFTDMVEQYAVHAAQVMDLSTQGDAKEADRVLKSVISMAEASLALLDEMIADADESIVTTSRNMNDNVSRSIAFLIILASVLVLFAVALSFRIVAAVKAYIADLRNAEIAAAQASRMKTVFLANMSHEIRTPMNGIIGFSELAMDDNVSPRTRDYLQKIKYSSQGLLQIINDILDVSKIEAGKMELENIPFDLQELFRVCQTIVAPRALEKGITMFCYAEPSIDKKLLGDPTKLRQALLNLLSNAVKFTNVGVVKLLSTVSEVSQDDVTVHFEIKDSGIGMTQEQLNRVFEPFVQADEGITRRFGGTGLGLPLTKSVIELMGGQLQAESVPGVGSKFSFDITFKAVGSPAQVETEEMVVDQFEKPSFEGEVLVCEDNSMNQQVIREHLTRVGLRTTIAPNGQEGVERVQTRINNGEPPFDLIYMDIHMPVMDGLEAARELVRIGNQAPVVALTANIMPNDRDTYIVNGMPDCLAKPFTAQALWANLRKYITPVSLKTVEAKAQLEADQKLNRQLLTNFFKDHQNTFEHISEAIRGGDQKLAHRLTHTLKGVAGLIGKTTLQEAAQVAERALTETLPSVSDARIRALALELDAVLLELRQTPGITGTQVSHTQAFDKEKVLGLFAKLEPLLLAGDTDCLDMTDALASVPGCQALIEQIEAFDFARAARTLGEIKSDLENG